MKVPKATNKSLYFNLDTYKSDVHISDYASSSAVRTVEGKSFHVKTYAPSKSYFAHQLKSSSESINEWLDYVESMQFNQHDTAWNFFPFLSATFNSSKHKIYSGFLSRLAEATSKYLEDAQDSNRAASPSRESLRYFLRYVPFFQHFRTSIYIDSASGLFGVTIEHETGLLDVQVKNNSDLIYTYARPGAHGRFPTITGEAIIDDGKDSKDVLKILRMIYE